MSLKSSARPGQTYRWALLPAACGIAISFLHYQLATDHGFWVRWSRWVSFTIWPVFHDLAITLQHLRQADDGGDPLSDPKSGFAYPRAVLGLRHLGLHHVPAEWLGFFQGVIFTIGLLIVLRPSTRRGAIGAALIFFTPSILLGFERANLDFALFSLCAVAAWLWSRSPGARGLTLPLSAMIGGAVLKLYPVFALLAGAVADTAKRRVYWLLGVAAVFLYWFSIRTEVSLVMAKIPVLPTASWGSLVAFARLEKYLRAEHAELWVADVDWGMVAVVTYGITIVLAMVVGRGLSARFRSIQWEPAEWSYYWIGAGICCGCFAGANFVYRWVFALLALPLLFRSLRSHDRVLVMWGRVTIGAMLVGFVAPFSPGPALFALVQAANWTCIVSLVIGCAALRVASTGPVRPVQPAVDSEPLVPAAIPAAVRVSRERTEWA